MKLLCIAQCLKHRSCSGKANSSPSCQSPIASFLALCLGCDQQVTFAYLLSFVMLSGLPEARSLGIILHGGTQDLDATPASSAYLISDHTCLQHPIYHLQSIYLLGPDPPCTCCSVCYTCFPPVWSLSSLTPTSTSVILSSGGCPRSLDEVSPPAPHVMFS